VRSRAVVAADLLSVSSVGLPDLTPNGGLTQAGGGGQGEPGL
jgi:hypothetical protein